MLNQIDISHFTEESYQLEELEVLFSEEGIFIMSSEGLFEIKNFENDVKQVMNNFILLNIDGDKLILTEEQYNIIKKLFDRVKKN